MEIYPKDIREIKDKDKYQIQFIETWGWSDIRIFNSNICRSKKEYYNYLILQTRIKIIEDE